MTSACLSHLLTDAEMLARAIPRVSPGDYSDPISNSKLTSENAAAQ